MWQLEIQRQAEECIRRGWYVVPIQPGGKRPILGDWVEQATNNPAVVATWLRQWPKMNLGMACGKSKVFVVDVDAKHGGMDSYRKTQMSKRRFPATLTQRTTGGGLHLIYSASEEFNPGNKKLDKMGLKGIETRGFGGQVVIAPSFNAETNRAYEWENWHYAISGPPRWLIDLLEEKPAPVMTISQRAMTARQERDLQDKPFAALDGLVDGVLKQAGQGNRNNYLFWAVNRAAELVARGKIGESLARNKLYEAARAVGLDVHEINPTINSAFKTARQKLSTSG